ncbi:hypothetical protein BDR05DRAFT_967320 [Suillus weaverae]|nr:hypothetical protein BDR05DRAFT_967320 [Suillus weaverae]
MPAFRRFDIAQVWALTLYRNLLLAGDADHSIRYPFVPPAQCSRSLRWIVLSALTITLSTWYPLGRKFTLAAKPPD